MILKVFLFLTIIVLTSTKVQAKPNFEGHFVLKHHIIITGDNTKDACLADRFTWGNGYCWTMDEDTTDIKKTAQGQVEVSVSTISNDDHTCQFLGPVTSVAPRVLKASITTQEWSQTRNTLSTVLCEVTVTYINQNTISVSNNGHCSSLCASQTSLKISSAIRN
jgi:hypothetical protein